MRLISLSAFLLCPLIVTSLLSAQESPYTIKLSVPLVSLNVEVLDSHGRAMTGLKRDDFKIYEDAELQEIQNFDPDTAPYNVMLLFDCSSSTRKEQPLFLEAAVRFAEKLRPQDKFAVALFGADVDVLLDFQSSKGQRPRALRSDTCSGTNFYDVLGWAVKKLRSVDGRKGVIVYTDGRDSWVPTRSESVNGRRINLIVDPSQDRDFQKVLQVLRQNSIPFYFVATNTDMNPASLVASEFRSDLRQTRVRMEQLAEASGGRVTFPRNAADVIPMYRQIADELGTAYTLTYSPKQPSNGTSTRQIVVRVDKEGAQVRQSRDRYSLPTPGSR